MEHLAASYHFCLLVSTAASVRSTPNSASSKICQLICSSQLLTPKKGRNGEGQLKLSPQAEEWQDLLLSIHLLTSTYLPLPLSTHTLPGLEKEVGDKAELRRERSYPECQESPGIAPCLGPISPVDVLEEVQFKELLFYYNY